MPETLAKFCCNRKQHFASADIYDGWMENSARKALADNLKAMMAKRQVKQTAVASRAKVAQTSVSNMLRPEKSSPRLDQIEKVAAYFGLSAWEMLIDPAAERTRIADRIFAQPAPVYIAERRVAQRRARGASKTTWAKGKSERRRGDRRTNGSTGE